MEMSLSREEKLNGFPVWLRGLEPAKIEYAKVCESIPMPEEWERRGWNRPQWDGKTTADMQSEILVEKSVFISELGD